MPEKHHAQAFYVFFISLFHELTLRLVGAAAVACLVYLLRCHVVDYMRQIVRCLISDICLISQKTTSLTPTLGALSLSESLDRLQGVGILSSSVDLPGLTTCANSNTQKFVHHMHKL